MKKRRVVYCFRIGAGAGFAQDRDGNPAECFLKLGVSLNEPEGLMTREEREKEREQMLESVAQLMHIDPSLVTMITKKEYLAETKKPTRYTRS